jgi:hypothetical protein
MEADVVVPLSLPDAAAWEVFDEVFYLIER